jgi:hypothetical protein
VPGSVLVETAGINLMPKNLVRMICRLSTRPMHRLPGVVLVVSDLADPSNLSQSSREVVQQPIRHRILVPFVSAGWERAGHVDGPD